jgi:hypothetical protein
MRDAFAMVTETPAQDPAYRPTHPPDRARTMRDVTNSGPMRAGSDGIPREAYADYRKRQEVPRSADGAPYAPEIRRPGPNGEMGLDGVRRGPDHNAGTASVAAASA